MISHPSRLLSSLFAASCITVASAAPTMHWLGGFTSVPASTIEGDAYHNNTDKKSYIRFGGMWKTLAEVSVGPQGPIGATGAPGARGATGPMGPVGPVGPNGADAVANLTVLGVNCMGDADFSTSYVKVADLGSFAKASATTKILATFTGRIAVLQMSGTGAVFEIRIDNLPTTMVYARNHIKPAEAGADGIQATIQGVFPGLGAGAHVVSLWVIGANGPGSGANVDPGCWSTSSVVVQEFGK
jgi:hypothetical protein